MLKNDCSIVQKRLQVTRGCADKIDGLIDFIGMATYLGFFSFSVHIYIFVLFFRVAIFPLHMVQSNTINF